MGVPVAECGGENNSQWRLIGALNALTGQVCYLDNYVVGRAKVIEMYQKLTQVYPQAETLYVVQDKSQKCDFSTRLKHREALENGRFMRRNDERF